MSENSQNILFCMTKSPKPKYIQFQMISNWEKQQILNPDNLEPANDRHSCMTNNWLINDLLNYYSGTRFGPN